MLNTSILKFALAALLAAGLIGCGCGCGGGGGYGGSGGGSGGGGGGPTYTIGGTVTGLNGAVVLQNSGGDDLTVSADGAFAFSTALVSGRAYNVTLRTQPSFPAQDCVVTNGAGIAAANVTNVALTCSTLANAELQADADLRSARLSWTSPALSWDPSSDRDVRALALAVSGNKVHIGGDFRALGGAVRSGLGTVDATGTGDVTP